MKKESVFLKQVLPLVLTIVIFIVLSLCVYVEVLILNKYTAVDIVKSVRWSDIAVGMTIYLKTSVDFAIFIGNLKNLELSFNLQIHQGLLLLMLVDTY